MRIHFSLSALCVATVVLAGSVQAQTAQTGSASRPPTRSTSGRGPLPDPALFDGSTVTPDKKSEYGMLGNFDIPGDENAKGEKSDKVGGQQPPPGAKGGGGAQNDPKAQGGGGAQQIPLGMPAGMAAGGGATSDGPPPKGGTSGQRGGGPGDPNAKAEGVQVADLRTDEANGPGGDGLETVQKPVPVPIGDPAMQIKSAANAPGVIGGLTSAGSTQQMEKATGSGGGGKGSPGNNSNRGAEKGRAMPAGL